MRDQRRRQQLSSGGWRRSSGDAAAMHCERVLEADWQVRLGALIATAV